MINKEEMKELDKRRNIVFFKTLDLLIIKKHMTRSMVAKNCGLDITCLNKSKTPVGRWIKLGTFFKICDVLEIEPQEFIDIMETINIEEERENNG